MTVDQQERPPLEVTFETNGGRSRLLGALWLLVVGLVVVGLIALLVFPTRAWIRQQRDVDAEARRLEAIERRNDELQARIDALQTPEEVERQAREQSRLIRPGEQVFTVSPAPPLTELPPGWPFLVVQRIMEVRANPPAAAVDTSTPTTVAGP